MKNSSPLSLFLEWKIAGVNIVREGKSVNCALFQIHPHLLVPWKYGLNVLEAKSLCFKEDRHQVMDWTRNGNKKRRARMSCFFFFREMGGKIQTEFAKWVEKKRLGKSEPPLNFRLGQKFSSTVLPQFCSRKWKSPVSSPCDDRTSIQEWKVNARFWALAEGGKEDPNWIFVSLWLSEWASESAQVISSTAFLSRHKSVRERHKLQLWE